MLLNGTSSRAETTGLGGISNTVAPARTLAAIVNRTSSSGFRNIISLNTSANGTQLDLSFNGTTMICEGATSTSNGPTVSTGKMYVAVDKASGSVTPRFHKQIYGTDAAVAHSNGSGAVTENSAISKVSLGTFSNNTDWFAGDLYVIGIWNRQLADTEHEIAASSLAGFLALQPDFLIVELGAALPTNIPDLSGNGAPVTTLTNLAVSTVSMPVAIGGPLTDVTHPGAAGGTTVSPAGLEHTRAQGSPSVNPQVVPAGLSHTRAQGSPAVAPQLRPASLAHTRAQGSPAVSPQAKPTGLSHTRALGSPTVALASVRALGNPTVTVQWIARPTGLAHTRAQGDLTVRGLLTLSPASLARTRAQGTPTLSARTLPASITRTRSLGSPSVNPKTLAPSALTRTRAQGSVTVTIVWIARPASITHTRTQGSPTVVGHMDIGPASLTRTRAQGTPVLSGRCLPASLTRTRALGAPAVNVATLAPASISRA